MERPSKGKLTHYTASNIYPNPHCTPGGAPAAQMRQPLPDTARRESREKLKPMQKNPVRTAERSDPRQRCGQACLSAAQKT